MYAQMSFIERTHPYKQATPRTIHRIPNHVLVSTYKLSNSNTVLTSKINSF